MVDAPDESTPKKPAAAKAATKPTAAKPAATKPAAAKPDTEPAVAAEPEASQKKTFSGRTIAFIAGGLVLLLIVGGVAWAIAGLFGQSATASAVAFPKSTILWTELAIDPSTPQKIEAIGFVGKFDALQESLEDADLDLDFDHSGAGADIKKEFWQFLVNEDTMGVRTSLKYDEDIRPWLGSRIAFGLVPGEDAAPGYVVAIEARQSSIAVGAMKQLAEDLSMDAEVSEKNGYVLISSSELDLKKAFKAGTLDQSPAFAASTKPNGSWGILSYWIDLGETYKLASGANSSTEEYADPDFWREQISLYPDSYAPSIEYDAAAQGYLYNGKVYADYEQYANAYVAEHLDELAEDQAATFQSQVDTQKALEEQLEGVTTSGVIRFLDDSLELQGTEAGFKDLPRLEAHGEPLSALPASTIYALSIASLDTALDNTLTDEKLKTLAGFYSTYFGAGAQNLSRDDVVDYFHDSLGVDFPDDLSVLFGNSVTVSADKAVDVDAFGDAENIGDVAESGVALTIETDNPAATAKMWKKVLAKLEDSAGAEFDLKVKTAGNRVVVSSGKYLAQVLAPKSKAGDLDAFKRALPDAEGSYFSLYADMESLVALLGGIPDDYKGLEGIGLTTTMESADTYSIRLRLTTEHD